VSFLNPGLVGPVVQLTISDDDGNSSTTGVVLAPRDLGRFDMSRLLTEFGGVFEPGEYLTLRYSSTQPIAAQYTAVIGDETMSTVFQTQLSDLVVLPNGFDADSGEEVISLYNPYDDMADVTLNFTIQFYFFDRNFFLSFSALPMLEPGERFEYTSGTPLPTPSGIMTGTYQMVGEDGLWFDVEIPAFSLDAPGSRGTVN